MYKDKILEHEDKIYKIDQDMMILLEIKKLFAGLKKIINLFNFENTSDNFKLNICEDWQMLFETMKNQKFYKIKNFNLKKQLFIEKIIHELQTNDIYYYLNKLGKFETTFKEYLLQSQADLKILDYGFSFEYTYNSSTYTSIYPIAENLIEEYFLNNKIKNNSSIMININFRQKQWLENYSKINLYLTNHKLNNLHQARKFRVKEKKRICIAANEFLYDQQIVNGLNINFQKIENKEIVEIINCLYSDEIDTPKQLSECNEISSEIREDKNFDQNKKKSDLDNEIFCMKYDARQHFSLIVMNNKNGNNISQYLQYPNQYT